ncbi:MAG: hypothetical protein ACLU62_02665 [Hydrogeniiclostridium sp.]
MTEKSCLSKSVKNVYFRNWLLVLAAGLLAAAVGFCAPFMEKEDASQPYMWNLLRMEDGFWAALAFLGAALTVCGAFALLFHNAVSKSGSLKTGAVAVALSTMGSAGLYCLFFWVGTIAFGEVQKYPIANQFSMAGGFVCLLICVLLLFLYGHVRQKRPSLLGIFLDVGVCVLFFAPMFLFWNFIYNLVERAL